MGKIKCKYQKGQKMIVDIQISEKSKKITFPSNDAAGNKLGISLGESDKVFPSVEVISYENQLNVDIPNAMFPNVKEVKTHSTTLYNVFFSEPGMEINLSRFEKIGNKAFEGCKTLNLVGTENIWSCASNAFENSVFSEQPFIKGMKIAGTILYDVDESYEIIDIPDYVTCIAVPEKFSSLKKVVIHSLRPKYLSCIANTLKADEIILGEEIGNVEFRENLDKLWFRKCKKLTLSAAIDKFVVQDGGVYEDVNLVLYPALRKGNISLPDGLRRIKKNAFLHSKVCSLSIPDSIVMIDEAAFSYCNNLTNIDFSGNINSLSFKKCKNISVAC